MVNHTKVTKEKAVHKGGEARAKKYTSEELSKQAKQGANTVEQSHSGDDCHSEIGKKGGTSVRGGPNDENNMKMKKDLIE